MLGLFCHQIVEILMITRYVVMGRLLCRSGRLILGQTKLSEPRLISVVDDDPIARSAIGDLIESLGYQVATVSSAERFLESANIGEVACLITDLQMPGMSGLDLQSRLRTDGYDTRVIFVTAYPEDRFRKRAMNAGAVGFLSKPFAEESLISCLRSALANTRQ
jgi:FixJ family two-component response regulator